MNFREWLTMANSSAELRLAFRLADQMTGRPRSETHRTLIALAEQLYKEAKDNA